MYIQRKAIMMTYLCYNRRFVKWYTLPFVGVIIYKEILIYSVALIDVPS